MIVYGINPVSELLRTGVSPKRIVVMPRKLGNSRIQGILADAKSKDVPIQHMEHLERITGNDRHQGICAEIEAREKELPDPPEIGDRVVIFDGIMDPHNFGAALRVCEVFGFTNIVYHKGNSSGLTAAAIKVSAGAAFHLDIYTCNLNSAIRRLQQAAYHILVLEGSGDTSIHEVTLPEKVCLVIGSEDKGPRHNIMRLANTVARIPMSGRVDSLNVSCALSAALAVLSRPQ